MSRVLISIRLIALTDRCHFYVLGRLSVSNARFPYYSDFNAAKIRNNTIEDQHLK